MQEFIDYIARYEPDFPRRIEGVETQIARLETAQAAVSLTQCRQGGLSVRLYGRNSAALERIASALQERHALTEPSRD